MVFQLMFFYLLLALPRVVLCHHYLFVLYSNKCQSHHEGRPILKCVDDSIIVSLPSDDDLDHGSVEGSCIDWCKQSFLDINVSKTKEMIIDFQRKPLPIPSVCIHGQAIEMVQQYKYLGVIIDDKFTFGANIYAVCMKAHRQIYFYRKLKSFDVETFL